MKLCYRPLTAFVLVAVTIGFMAGPSHADEGGKLYQTVLHATAWIRTPHGSGTGWVADQANRLIVTNNHVVETNETVSVTFPEYSEGKVISEREWYITNGKPQTGRVITTDRGHDLAVIQVDELPKGVVALKLADQLPDPGDTVHTVGNPGASGGLWVYSFGTVRTLYREKDNRILDGRVVETQVPINPGDSGSALVNGHGDVVGVNFYHREGSLVNLSIDVREVKEILPQARREIAPASARDFFLRAEKRTSQRRFDDAMKDYTTAIDKDPKLVAASVGRASVYNDLMKYNEAIADCDSALKLNKDEMKAYQERGYARLQLGQMKPAVSDFTEGLRLSEGNRTLLWYRGCAYLRDKQYDKALDDFSEAMEPAERAASLLSVRGEAYLGLGKYNLALKDLNQALRIEPKNATAFANRAKVYMQQKKFDHAMMDLDRAIEIQPLNADFYKFRAEVYEAMGHDGLADLDREEARRLAGG